MKNPVWNNEELILALDLYFHMEYGQMHGRNPQVKALSAILIVVCANCHRMIHRKKGITLTLEELKQKINPILLR
ncbi:hypothetical protein FACS189437_09810 [Bacteroidia bacterium]|nr:hypothetical protein FACS189437_09810 [Bacteroidia bacterium]